MFEKFEKWIRKLQSKVDKKFMFLIVYAFVGVIAIFGMQMANMYKREKQKVQDVYNKAMYGLVNYAQNVDVLFSKARITTTSAEVNKTLADIWRQADLAKDSLSALPVDQHSMSQTSKFLAQASDYSYSLMLKSSSGRKLTEEDYEMLAKINDNSAKITKTLNKIYNDLNSGRLKWNEVEKQGDKKLSKIKGNKVLSNIRKNIRKFYRI